MGRTLHYSTNHKPTLEENRKLIDLERKYYKEIEWTCETPTMSSLQWYPNWDKFKTNGVGEDYQAYEKKQDNIWETIEKRIKEIIKEGLHEADAIMKAKEEGLLLLHTSVNDETGTYGFTKTRGNELNAHAVIQFVYEVSKNIMPKVEIELSDEGNSLYCPIILKGGKAKPDLKDIKNSLEYWKGNEDLHNNGMWDVTSQEEYYKKLLELKPSWGVLKQYIRPLSGNAIGLEQEKIGTQVIKLQDGENIEDKLQDMFMSIVGPELEAEKLSYEDIQAFPQL